MLWKPTSAFYGVGAAVWNQQQKSPYGPLCLPLLLTSFAIHCLAALPNALELEQKSSYGTIMPPPLAHFVRNSLPRCAPQCEHIGTNCVETSSRYHLKEQRVKVKPSLCYTLSSTLRFELFVSLELFPPSFTAHGVSIPCSPCK